jgi:hypothetical protein
MRHRITGYVWIVLACGWLCGVAHGQDKKPIAPPPKDPPPNAIGVPVPPPPDAIGGPPAPPPLAGLGIVYVVNEVGENERLTLNLREVFQRTRPPFCIETVHWTSYDGRRKDHRDPERRVQAATCLANKATQYRQAYPHARVIFLSQGDGCHIALMAAEMMPPKSVDRIILLAPAVTCCYDLRMALRATRDGIDNFFSNEDMRSERLQDILRTADGKKDILAAGLVGFRLPAPQFPGMELYQCLLRQHKWDGDGGENFNIIGWHNSWIRQRFLRAYIVPLLSITEPVCVAPPPLVAPPPVVALPPPPKK